jgi:hypothetical protein
MNVAHVGIVASCIGTKLAAYNLLGKEIPQSGN